MHIKDSSCPVLVQSRFSDTFLEPCRPPDEHRSAHKRMSAVIRIQKSIDWFLFVTYLLCLALAILWFTRISYRARPITDGPTERLRFLAVLGKAVVPGGVAESFPRLLTAGCALEKRK